MLFYFRQKEAFAKPVKSYNRKLSIAIALVIAVAALLLFVVKAPVFTTFWLLIASIIILNRHLARCERCGSWKTFVEKLHLCSHHSPPRKTRNSFRDCSVCGYQKFL